MCRAFFSILLPSLLLVACGVTHGPVSGGTVAQLNAQAVTPKRAEAMLSGKRLSTRSTPPGDVLHMPMILDRAGLPHIATRINSHTNELLFDSGATITVLDADFAVRHRIATLPDVQPQMMGVMGKESGMGGIIESLQIGAWSVTNLPCVVRLQRSSSGMGFLGEDLSISLLGFHLAQKHCRYVTLDYPRRSFEFGFTSDFRGPKSPRHVKSSFKLQYGVPMATVRVGKVSWEAIVDTGSCFGVEIDQKLAQKLGHASDGRHITGDYLMIGVGGAVKPQDAGVRVINVPELSMIGSTFKNPQLDVMPGPARIGSFFLKDYRVTFDFQRKTIWLEW